MLEAYLSRGRSEDARALMKQMSARGLQANKVPSRAKGRV